jgi:hypothetical protein
MVEKQLQIMFHIDLVPNISALRTKSEGGMLVGSSEEVGEGKGEAKMRRIVRSKESFFLED